MLVIKQATSEEQINLTHELFMEYAKCLGIDLTFQNFEEELNSLPGDYALPIGCILLAYYNDELAGCVALRKFKEEVCEMKRLFVRSQFRKKGIGRALSNKIIDQALKIGYHYMRLDTLPHMKVAIALYHSLGFKEIKPYRYNPFEGAKFLELKLLKKLS
ncbi:MAG: GNAT family N-acetyltransferase [Candidatus Odinarchaeota archaeon]